ncbi:MAG: prepilin peptidase [Candidatus Omnitrophota bacterium]
MVNLFVFVIGAVVGSFLNVCIYRLPKGQSIVMPPSHCPKCGTRIAWYDNIPFVSYLLLKGRCRACSQAISFRYFLVELIAAALITALFLKFGLNERFFAYSLLTSALIIATFVDLEIEEIPDEVTISVFAAGIIFSALFPSLFGESVKWRGLLQSLAGALAGGGAIYLTGVLGEMVFKKEAMGGGDVKLMAMAGAFLGWELVILAFFIAPFFGSITGIIMKIKRGAETIPYGPYLSLAVLIAIFFGERIIGMLFYGV